MIVVTGATGSLNGSTVDHLLATTPAAEIAVVVRDPARARSLEARGVEVRTGDYADPSSLPAAFADAEQLLLVSSNDRGVDTVALHREALGAAVAAGVGRILYTSHQGAAADSPFLPARVHAATEQMLADSGVAWTALRNGFYAHSLAWLLGPWQQTGAIAVPADGPVSWTAREDAAEAAAIVLAASGGYDGPITITAPSAPTFAEIADLASEVAGRPIGHTVIDSEEWIAQTVDAGQPEAAALFTLGVYQAAAGGFFAETDPLLSDLIGREPHTVRDQLRELLRGPA